MRVLVTVKPKMYRETLALALHERRPGAKVMLAPPGSLDGQMESVRPDLLVRNDNDGLSPENLHEIAYQVEILLTDGMGARIDLDGRVREIADMSMYDLLAVLDEVEELVSRAPME